MTEDEYQKIKSEGLEPLIDELSLYIASSGKTYKSHYAAIRQWANRRKKEKNEPKIIKTQFNTGLMTRADDVDLGKLIKN